MAAFVLTERVGAAKVHPVDARAIPAEVASVAALREGDQGSFAAFVDRWYGSSVRFARVLLHDDELARRAARDAWLLTIRELPTHEEELPVHVTLLAATLASAAATVEAGASGPAVDPASFEPEGSRWQGWWLDDRTPEQWREPPGPELVTQALERLEPATATVVLLRDIERLPADEVEALLGFPADDQRTLLHQGRIGIWQSLGPKGDGA